VRRDAVRAADLLERALNSVEGPVADRRSFIHAAGTAFPATVALAAAVEPDRKWDRWWRLWRDHGGELVDPTPLLSADGIAGILAIEPGPGLGRTIDALVEAQVRGVVRSVGGARKWLWTTFKT
jgi:hypothetical protein